MKALSIKTLVVSLLIGVLCCGINYAYCQVCDWSGTAQNHRDYYDSMVGFNNGSQLAQYDLSVNGATKTVGFAIHIVRFSDESGAFSETNVQDALDALESGFDQARIEFALIKRDTISDDDYASGQLEWDEALANAYNVPNVINIYFMPTGGDNLATFSPSIQAWMNMFLPEEGCARYGQYVMIRTVTPFAPTVLPHEVGHFFDLFHPHENQLGLETIEYQSGDMTPDTPPTTIPIHDCQSGDENERELAKNYMSGTSSSGCRQNFTTIQIQRIRFSLFNRRSSYMRTQLQFSNTINSQNAGGSLKAVQDGFEQTTSSQGELWLGVNRNAQGITLQERFSNYQGSGVTYKHHDWNEIGSQFTLARTFNVQPGEHQVARFANVFPCTLYGELTSGGSGVKFEFEDPWYLKLDGTQSGGFVEYTNSYSPTGAQGESSGGVFLNQSGPPYYSIRAPLSQLISGSTAFFQGWSYHADSATLQQVGSNPAGYDQKAVVFKLAGATVTAQYAGPTFSSNATIPAGTYTVSGTLTVSSGATLTIGAGTTLHFPTGTGLVVNGRLVAEGTSQLPITLNCSSGNNYWMGISFSNADNSSLSHCTIDWASSPVVVSNTDNITIDDCTIGNSNFQGSPYYAAMSFYGSSCSISNTIINGQTGSWNGMRFADESSGEVENCTIQNCRAGNGIVIQDGSEPLITGCTVKDNYYHGIIALASGQCTLTGNTIEDNGVVDGQKIYVGVNMYDHSSADLWSNTIDGSNYGIYC
ncbi:MAG: right-handed parallel beta-helix repeat-containing protein, partial [Bacteroidota bacterium]